MPVPSKISSSNTFGEALFFLRRKRRMQQKHLALAAGLDQSYLASLERGRRIPPGARTIEKIISGLQASPDEEARLTNAALIGRAEKLFLEYFAGGPQTPTMVKVLSALPRLEVRDLEAIEAVTEGFLRQRDKETNM